MNRVVAYIKITQVTLWILTTLAISCLVYQLSHGAHTIEIFDAAIAGVKVGLGLRFDILSTVMLFMVTSLGATIGHYADRYLDGEQRQQYFYKHLMGIVASASLLVLSSNLLMFFGMWLTISYNLHKLLIYYSDRPQAVMAARKKAIVSRIGDVALLLAILLTYQTFGSFDFADVLGKIANTPATSSYEPMLSIIGVLMAAGALTKSAQYPFHFWLPDTMETPTPVSALMHAGVINAGGFLIIRMSPLFESVIIPNAILILVGTTSAAFGALCMIVQNDIKRKLAFSTISQMGMMMLACGLGAYSMALFHIFAHGFYKAHAFLSTGKLVEESKKIQFAIKPPSALLTALAGLSGLSIIGFSGVYQSGQYLPVVTYCSILGLGLLQNCSNLELTDVSSRKAIPIIVFGTVTAFIVYALIEYFLGQNIEQFTTNFRREQSGLYGMIALSIFSFFIFLASMHLASRLMNINTPLLQKTYVYLRNGGYLGLKVSVILSRISQPGTANR